MVACIGRRRLLERTPAELLEEAEAEDSRRQRQKA
jgi:hypothetical protein